MAQSMLKESCYNEPSSIISRSLKPKPRLAISLMAALVAVAGMW